MRIDQLTKEVTLTEYEYKKLIMTQAELLAKIKAEIERLKTVQLERIQEGDLIDAEPYDKNEAYNELLSFLDTLESEKPSGPTIEEPIDGVLYAAACGIKNATEESEKPMDQDEELTEEIKRFIRTFCVDKFPTVNTIARHFAQWGAEWQAKQDQETIELAEDHAYFAGAVNEREKMMKEAVEGEVWDFSSSLEAYPHINIPLDNKQYRSGDKVRIIIVKEA